MIGGIIGFFLARFHFDILLVFWKDFQKVLVRVLLVNLKFKKYSFSIYSFFVWFLKNHPFDVIRFCKFKEKVLGPKLLVLLSLAKSTSLFFSWGPNFNEAHALVFSFFLVLKK